MRGIGQAQLCQWVPTISSGFFSFILFWRWWGSWLIIGVLIIDEPEEVMVESMP